MSSPVVVETRPLLEPRSKRTLLARGRDRALATLARIAWLPPLLARVAVGGTFVTTGWGKLHDLTKVTNYFIELGLPAPAFLARLVGATELTCGLLILIGLFARIAAIPLIAVMAMAIATARMSDVHGVADFLGLEELTYAVVFAWLVVAGPGRVSIDALLAWWSKDWDSGHVRDEVKT